MNPSRRRVLLNAIELLATAGLLATFGCGDDDPGDPGGGSAAGGGGAADCGDTAISANHGHALLVPWADVLAGQDMSYSIQASATHDHQVTVTAADLAQLAGGNSVTLTSTTTAQHSHQVQVSCP